MLLKKLCLLSLLTVSYQVTNSLCNLEYNRNVWLYYNGFLNSGLESIYNKTYNTLISSYNIIFLTPENLSSYVNQSDLPNHFQGLYHSHKSDYLRVLLLYLYGGWYFDFSTLVTSQQYLDQIIDETARLCAELVVFAPHNNTRWCSLNVLYAPRKSSLLRLWFEEVKKACEYGLYNYIYSVYRDGVNFRSDVWCGYPELSNYFFINVAYRVVITRKVSRSTSILGLDLYKGQYALHASVGFQLDKVKALFLEELADSKQKYPITKLRQGERNYIWPELRIQKRFEGQEPHPLIRGSPIPKELIRRLLMWLIYLSLVHPVILWYLWMVIMGAIMNSQKTSINFD